jgi:hypothetical protein
MDSIHTTLNEKVSKQQQKEKEEDSGHEQEVFYFAHQSILDQAVLNKLSRISNPTDISTQMDENSITDGEKKN